MSDYAGHKKVIDNFEILISFCSTNPEYNPITSELIITNLITKLKASRASLNAVIASSITYENNLISCRNAMAELCESIDKIIYESRYTKKDVTAIKRSRTILRRLQSETQAALLMPGDAVLPFTAVAAILRRQDKHFETLSLLIRSFLAGEAISLFSANCIYELGEKLRKLQAIGAEVMSKFHTLCHSCQTRNDILYNSQTGLISRANRVKNYVRTVFGETSSQFIDLNKITFADFANYQTNETKVLTE